MSESAATQTLMRLAARLRGKKAEDNPNIVKQLLVTAWKAMDWDERAAFMARLDDDLEFDERGISIKAYLNGWDLVMNMPMQDDWREGFAKSVAGRRKNPAWYPSDREAKLIKEMYLEALQYRQSGPEEGDVLE